MKLLIGGDSNEALKTIQTETVDLLLTDPPYFLPAKHYATRKTFSRNFSDLGILESFFRAFFNEIKRVMKKTGIIYMFCDGQSYPLFYYYCYFFTKSVRPLIWDKKTSINGYHWRHQHEIILFAEMPAVEPVPTGDGDILRFSAVKVDDRIHPAQKPEDLITSLILKSSKENDTVLDPFMGSGTTGVCAIRNNRSFIGIELDKEYIKVAEDRIAKAKEIGIQI